MNPFGLLVGALGVVLVIIGTRGTQDKVWSMLTGRGASGTAASTTPSVAAVAPGSIAWHPVPSGLGTGLFQGIDNIVRIR